MKNWVDWVILVALLGALIRGYRAGLLSTFFSAIGFIGGGFAGLFLSLHYVSCLLYTSPSPRDGLLSRMPSSA